MKIHRVDDEWMLTKPRNISQLFILSNRIVDKTVHDKFHLGLSDDLDELTET